MEGWQGSPLYFQGALLRLGEDVGVADDPEEGEEGETASQDCAVELDTPHAGWQGGTAQQDGDSLRASHRRTATSGSVLFSQIAVSMWALH